MRSATAIITSIRVSSSVAITVAPMRHLGLAS
jgi:hypothetical protein